MANRKQPVVDDPAALAVDKVLEKRLAELIGTTSKALEHKRLSGIIPHGVWLKEHGRIMYSLERYNEWAEKQWVSLMASTPGAKAYASVLLSTVSVEASRLPISQPRRGSPRPVVSVLV
ncbi:hypothetical protein [Pseudomonas chlororaphis]|uniref:hypothetical protein n=1 Tax=Pseudomonas chlororaphis TaxID=587753 RepID=UPI002FCD6266